MEVIDGNYELDINPKKVCRLCLSQPPTLQNIFSKSVVDGYIIPVPDMLSFTVDITVGLFHFLNEFSMIQRFDIYCEYLGNF